jgi:hypothetical protein
MKESVRVGERAREKKKMKEAERWTRKNKDTIITEDWQGLEGSSPDC